jgi:ribosomal protein L32
MRECPTCHQQTPDGNFCVRCGAPLAQALAHARQRQEFAAAPGERLGVPWLVSTLFPHLPRHSDRHFHVALAGGAALVVVLGILGLFPVALISAALLMPLLTVLYFYDVDIYQGEPGWASVWTLAWGAATGVGIGLLARATEPSGIALINRGSAGNVITGGILIPALGVAAMLGGPLVLLRYRRFNGTLDGASFGAATAATFAAAQAIVVGADLLSAGLRPAGAPAPWVARLVGIAIATPVLAMSVIGAATAAIWLRYRAPAKDSRALGWAGTPVPAVAFALVLVIAGAIGETFMAAGVWLAWVILLDLVGLLLLRRALHVGLLEEAADINIGPPIRCANCGATTETHTFCSNCGIALKALPKVRGAPGSEAQQGAFSGRLQTEAGAGRRGPPLRLIAAVVAIAAVAGVAVAIVEIVRSGPRKPPCKLGQQCGRPPILGHVRVVFQGYTPWQSTALGYALRFDSARWRIGSQSPTDMSLQADDGVSTISFHGAPTAQASPRRLIDESVASLQGQTLGLVPDSDRSDTLLGSGVGLRPGAGNVYQATTSTPQGPGTPIAIAIMAATDGRVTIAVTVTAPANNPDQKQRIFGRADDIVNSVQWGTP